MIGFFEVRFPERQLRMFSILTLFRRSRDEQSQISGTEVGGVGAVVEALNSNRHGPYQPNIYFDEPRLVDRAVGPTTDLYVVFPTMTAPDDPEPANVEFALPENPDDQNENLNQFLDDIEVDSIEDVEETEIESTQVNGVLRPSYDSLNTANIREI